MDVKLIFREVAKKLMSDFNISAQIHHQGLTGTFREAALKDFLSSGRLPGKYGIGSGEIVGPTSEISRQCDLIIYDTLNCPVLIFGDSVQVFPSEGVYGIIEVKSRLSKKKLLEGLENIAAFKKIVPEGIKFQQNEVMGMTYKKERPFGIIFAYSLDNNSLYSLISNLREYEKKVDSDLWPNMVVVLDEGIIWHTDEQINPIIRSEEFTDFSMIGLHFKQDSLFEFYLKLLDLLSTIKLGNFNFSRYKELPKKVGNHFVTGHDRFITSEGATVSSLNERIIDRVYEYCQAKGKISYRDVLILELGEIPDGLTKDKLDYQLYYYDPEHLPGIHEVEHPFKLDKNGNMYTTERMRCPNVIITIDGETYEFPYVYILPEDFSIIPGKRVDDL